jgi:hypothetical protein
MPNAFVSDMTIQTREKDLIAVTHGRGIYKTDLEPLYEHWTKPSQAATFLHHTKAILPENDASGRKPDLSTYENMGFSFSLPQAQQLELTILNEEGETIFTDVYSAKEGLNTYSWDLTLEPDAVDDNPYAFRLIKLVEAGDYTIRLVGKEVTLERTFWVVER